MKTPKTIKEAIAEYDIFLQSLVDNETSDLTDETKLDPNVKQRRINKFFVEFDKKSESKSKELINQFALSEISSLNSELLKIGKEQNERFKNIMNEH